MKRRLGVLLIDRGGLIALVVLAMYAWLAPAHIVNGDNAEFSALAAVGGAAHPPGYPAYVMWLRAWSWLSDNPAHAAALATCLLTGLQTLVLHAACRAWGAKPAAAGVAVALYAAGPIVLRVQSEAEVFAPHALICALVLWISAADGPLRGRARVAALGLVAGLGMANQLTCVLLAPVGLLGGARGVREGGKLGIALGIGGLALGLSAYAYLLVAPDNWASWGAVRSFHDLWWHALRMDYGGPGRFLPTPGELAPAQQLVALARTTGASLAWVGGVGALLGLGYQIARPSGETRGGWIALAASWLVCGPIIVTRFDVTLDTIGIYIVQRFHLMSVLLLVVPLAVGMSRLGATAIARRPALARPILAAVLPVLVFVGVTARSLPYLARIHSRAMERGCENMLLTLPPNAVVFGSSDAFHFGLNYLQAARYERRDVTVITVEQLKLDYYRERVTARTGVTIDPNPDQTINVPLAEKLMAAGHPVFADKYELSLVQAFPSYPYGILYRVLPRGTITPSLDWVYRLNVALFDMYKFDYMAPGPHDEIASTFHNAYARVWHFLSLSLGKAGKKAEAEDALRRAYVLAPESEE